MRIVLASDHAGARLKARLAEFLRSEPGVTAVEDLCGDPETKSDYPRAAFRACARLVSGAADRAVLVCGSGIGIAMAANRIRGVRAVCASCATEARLARAHNDANAVALGERLTGIERAQDIVRAFLATPFEGGRHCARVDLLDDPDPLRPDGKA